jgi:hypothetical protein
VEHRVTIVLNSSSAHPLRMAEVAIASVWVLFILLAKAQEERNVFHRPLPATPEAK